ncbi:N-ATPase subunit AtpR [Nostoc sp.]|uniref:N-ATPase subunit AtpR n=1 Tax=Nostoc sp. TaxID=1180 RepID=UPI003FA56F91
MNSLLFLPVTLVLGNLYFRGLWMTVQKLPTAESPILLTLGSFFGRLAIAIIKSLKQSAKPSPLMRN